jgi:hypothetical protein
MVRQGIGGRVGAAWGWRRSAGRYEVLLATLLALPLVEGLVLGKPELEVLYWVGFLSILFAALCATDPHGRSRVDEILAILPGVLAAATLPLVGLTPKENLWFWVILRTGAAMCAFVVLAWRILRDVLRAKVVVFDQVCGGLCVYMMLGFASAMAYTAVERIAPGSFAIDRARFGMEGDFEFAEKLRSLMTYFSFITLTTLGFGDVTPASPVARGLVAIEAIVGQLYMAVFVARLVSLHLAAAVAAPVPQAMSPSQGSTGSSAVPAPHLEFQRSAEPTAGPGTRVSG